MSENKNIREQSIEELLPYILAFGNKTLSNLEQTFLKEMLVNHKTFNELTKLSKLTVFRQRQVFNNAVKRLSIILDEANGKLNNYDKMGKELAETKENLTKANEKLEALQNSIDKRNKLSPELKELLDTPIDKVGFSARVRNICSKAEIETISDLVHYSRRDMTTLRDMGQKSLDEIETYLKSKGLSWKMRF